MTGVVRSGVLIAAMLASTSFIGAQAATPVNDRPNPYRTFEGWARLPTGRTWGSTSAVAIDKDGVSVWVAERCGQNSCVGSTLDPILLFNRDGDLRSYAPSLKSNRASELRCERADGEHFRLRRRLRKPPLRSFER